MHCDLVPVVDDLHISILLNPQLTHDDVVNTTCGVCPCVRLIVPGEKTTTQTHRDKGTPKTASFLLVSQKYLLGQLQCDDAFWLSFHTLTPELEFGVDGSMKHKVFLQALSVEGADRRVVAHLLRYEPEAQIISGITMEKQQDSERMEENTAGYVPKDSQQSI